MSNYFNDGEEVYANINNKLYKCIIRGIFNVNIYLIYIVEVKEKWYNFEEYPYHFTLLSERYIIKYYNDNNNEEYSYTKCPTCNRDKGKFIKPGCNSKHCYFK